MRKLFSKAEVNEGELMPEAWISLGTRKNKWRLKIELPLFKYAWDYNYCWDRYVRGWYVPFVSIDKSFSFYTLHWGYIFHSDFMGEELYERY